MLPTVVGATPSAIISEAALTLPSPLPEETPLETVVPFRAWRYGSKAGEPALLVAPPYDVIGPALQSRLYARSRYNVIRVDLGMTTPGDSACDDQYTRAAAQLALWKEGGILLRDAEPSLTFVQQSFTGPDGQARVRHGFLAAMRLYEFAEGVVFPHEHTLSAPKEDRYRLMTATAMSLSPVFLLYDLPGDEITTAWRSGLSASPPAATVADEDGTITKVWPTSDRPLLKTARRSLENGRFIIADGHHRYETALRYRNHRRAEADTANGNSSQAGTPAYDYALVYLSNMADPGLAIYGTHRLVAGLDPDVVRNLPRSLAGAFAVERLTAGSGAPDGAAAAGEARAAIEAYLTKHPRHAFGLWGSELDAAYGLRLRDAAATTLSEPGCSITQEELDVTILQVLVLDNVLGIGAADMAAEEHVAFFSDPSEAFARLEAGDFQAGFFMNPTGLDQIRQAALSGERMPQKATFFYPKLPTGLVFQDLDGSL